MSHHSEVLVPFFPMGIDLSITTPVAIMWGTSLAILLFLGMANRVEYIRKIQFFFYDFIVESFGVSLDTKKKIWFSLLMTVFLFVFFNNLSGLIPGGESPTSNINVTGAMALLIFLISQGSGVWVHGWRHITHLVPNGIPKLMLIFFIPLEIVSLMAKPFSLAVRLFANMFAGHKVLTIFAGLAIVSPSLLKALPFSGVVLISLFEIFVAFIQSFIFTYLTSFYIGDAVSGSH